jgi:hypothetical protein
VHVVFEDAFKFLLNDPFGEFEVVREPDGLAAVELKQEVALLMDEGLVYGERDAASVNGQLADDLSLACCQLEQTSSQCFLLLHGPQQFVHAFLHSANVH